MRLFEGTPFDRPPRCEICGELEAECVCPPPEPERISPGKQTARVAVEKRKGGRKVTVVRGLATQGHDLSGLLATLKLACGAGGTVKEDLLEIQGEQAERVRAKLLELGYKVR
jgi:translation initiation factor 1